MARYVFERQASATRIPDVHWLTFHQIDQLPLSFNLSDSLFRGEVQIDGSLWANSFIHGSNGHDYYVAAHAQNYASDIEGAVPSFRAGILDLTDPSFYVKYIDFPPVDSSFYAENGEYHAVWENYGMETTSADPLQGIRAYSSFQGVEFDLTFNFTSPVLLNAALGSYLISGDYGFEWSLPKGITEGWLKVNGEVIDIIPEKSSSWFDRQWASLQDSFTWFMINMEESDWLDYSTLCVWDWEDAVHGPKEFATVRSAKTGYDSVVPAKVVASPDKVYTSPETGDEYPYEWTVYIDDLEIFITTPRPDQIWEADADTGFPSQVSGYVDVVVKKDGHPPIKGWGATDVMDIA